MDAAPKEPDPKLPKGVWGSILTTTPIALTVLATAFAGLSSSEMTRSMYYRSLAAQHQSKAGDQWAFFQAKRQRFTSLDMTDQLLQSLSEPDDFEPAQAEVVCDQMLQLLLKVDAGAQKKIVDEAQAKIKDVRGKFLALLAAEKTTDHLTYLNGAALPKVAMRTLDNKDTQQAIDAVVQLIEQRKTDGETAEAVAKVKPADIEKATQLAEEDADLFDKANEPVNDMLKQYRKLLKELAVAVKPLRSLAAGKAEVAQMTGLVERLTTSFKVAALDLQGRRYNLEADYNKHAAEMYEVRVRRSGVESDRHRNRSENFFYCMLLAQAGVTISSLALARTQHNLLWLLAALAGIVALAFSAYVYLLL